MVINAIEPEVEETFSIQAENVVEGRYLRPGEGDAIFIGRGLADLLEAGVGDRINVVGRSKQEQMRQRTMTIVGIYDMGIESWKKARSS